MPAANPNLLPLPPQGILTVRHYRTGNPLRIAWENFGVLKSIEPGNPAEAEEIWLAPGLFDLQVNGYSGVDFQRENSVSEASLLKLIRALRRDGCHRILLTLITSKWDSLLNRIHRYRAIIAQNTELRRAIAGWHIEGPFLSDQPGFRGAHNPAWMTDASPNHIRELREATGTDAVLLTLAPERTGSNEAIAEAVRCGFVVSLGHTNANPEQLRTAGSAGATAFTHLANGCPQLLDRHENILWAVLNEPSLTAGIIPDGIHVSPALFRILHQVLTSDRVYWTTDAMAAAGAPPGRYTIGATELLVGEDQVVRNPATNSFAGSALRPIEGIRRGAKMLDQPWQNVWDYFSVHPAKLMGLPADLTPGSPAGFCLLRSV